jgi:periplasmic protein TonB
MARRALMLREGKAPVRDRLLVMIFLAALVHGMIILGLTFNVSGGGHSAPGLEVLLVSDELPEADKNDSATYLAQRTQLGSGNTREAIAPRNRASAVPLPAQEGLPDGDSLGKGGNDVGNPDERVLTTSAWNVRVHYQAPPGNEGMAPNRPLQLDSQPTDQPGPQDDTGPVQLRGPKRDELWVTPDTRAATLAPYLDGWRRKIERMGTLNFPTAARKAGTRASPVIEVGIAASGKLDRALIQRSSGDPELDQAALQIVKLASPFDPFPPELAREYRVLRFVYEYQFVGGRVEAGKVSTVP